MNERIKRGDIFLANLDPTIGTASVIPSAKGRAAQSTSVQSVKSFD
jgi:hypothetical protein